MLTVFRWWFGLTYVFGGVGVIVAEPVMILMGDYGGTYLTVGGMELVVLGWLIHPWGLQRMRHARVVS